MKFSSLRQCLDILKQQGELLQINHRVDPNLEMAEITRRVFNARGPAILFTNIKGNKFSAVSNLFGTFERTLKIFEPQLASVKALVDIKSDFGLAYKSFGNTLKALPALAHSLPIKVSRPKVFEKNCGIQDLPMIKCWPGDGGAFILLPQVFSQDPEKNSLFSSNLGMYRVQISGNDYHAGKEVGLHYQLHRGIGNHHKKALEKNKALRVSIFVGGPPAHTLAAVMPLPEGVPEIAFAGALAGKNFKYAKKNGYLISADADFCITGVIVPGKTKREGPFGDHLGYYSMEHEYPYLKVDSVYHRKDAIFPFTIVGRPPQEDSNFGKLIHEITRSAIPDSIPGVIAVNAVDDSGVHPLLLVKAHERYVPYEKRAPRELLTHASRILGTGQLSLAKYVMICAQEDNPGLDVNDEKAFFTHLLERIDFSSDLHFFTKTTMDTLDYSTQDINQGSKLVMAAAGIKKRYLKNHLPQDFSLPEEFDHPIIILPGIVVLEGPHFKTYAKGKTQIGRLKKHLKTQIGLDSIPLFVVVDDSDFTAKSFSNFLWVAFLRSNPSHDIYGVNEKVTFKHWECEPPLIIDARIKPFHAKPLVSDKKVAQKIDALGKRGGPLFGII
ncbi:MAG: UbiD family decarboxylase [Desulfobacula sp.]|jgi:4-hydroxy-3-polyprenylbenzoate decarboxylase|uniref:UbiD family decarboxylase n=1 Tax=Desulfobacula sp. TaxID=2593537 RepID=UPI001DD04457|nr:UbiD family decarboxylase [Desulfobacula sp.]MBT3484375.1 UbiD family decarboxylase [Desulfobacula sp.]MBT3803290.1 UbiD family decarboxylase [Desulfobacula sp.]MBT4023744.1 UbiD family decarboxylase [Desulfobacula sp.]MBT4197986.1 UbiD family decarboxylase [Desulfobacula sp.]